MKYFIIAGEASGDLHGANLMEGIKKTNAGAEFVYFGGSLMSAQGGILLRHYKEMAFMGFIDVLKNIKKIGSNFNYCKKKIKEYLPDVIILIDYPSFNLNIAKFANSLGLKVFYYISPKIWAWKEYRIKAIRKYVDRMFVIFPFEIDYYKKFNYDVFYEGNPLVDKIESKIVNKIPKENFIRQNNLTQKPIIAILPGSRISEIERILPRMLHAIQGKYKEYQFVIAGTGSIDPDIYHTYIENNDVSLIFDQTYDLLSHSAAAIVTSGTATLETALFNVPEVACYYTSKINYLIAKQLVNVKFITLVNLVMDKLIIKELLQNDLNDRQIQSELDAILYNEEYRMNMINNFQQLRLKLGTTGSANRIARRMYNFLKE